MPRGPIQGAGDVRAGSDLPHGRQGCVPSKLPSHEDPIKACRCLARNASSWQRVGVRRHVHLPGGGPALGHGGREGTSLRRRPPRGGHGQRLGRPPWAQATHRLGGGLGTRDAHPLDDALPGAPSSPGEQRRREGFVGCRRRCGDGSFPTRCRRGYRTRREGAVGQWLWPGGLAERRHHAVPSLDPTGAVPALQGAPPRTVPKDRYPGCFSHGEVACTPGFDAGPGDGVKSRWGAFLPKGSRGFEEKPRARRLRCLRWSVREARKRFGESMGRQRWAPVPWRGHCEQGDRCGSRHRAGLEPRAFERVAVAVHEGSSPLRAEGCQRRPTDPTVSHTPLDPCRREDRAGHPRPHPFPWHPPPIVKGNLSPHIPALPVPALRAGHPFTTGEVRHETTLVGLEGDPHPPVRNAFFPAAVRREPCERSGFETVVGARRKDDGLPCCRKPCCRRCRASDHDLAAGGHGDDRVLSSDTPCERDGRSRDGQPHAAIVTPKSVSSVRDDPTERGSTMGFFPCILDNSLPPPDIGSAPTSRTPFHLTRVVAYRPHELPPTSRGWLPTDLDNSLPPPVDGCLPTSTTPSHLPRWVAYQPRQLPPTSRGWWSAHASIRP